MSDDARGDSAGRGEQGRHARNSRRARDGRVIPLTHMLFARRGGPVLIPGFKDVSREGEAGGRRTPPWGPIETDLASRYVWS
jgi:hypothetical protein